jgi:hypothetical protein
LDEDAIKGCGENLEAPQVAGFSLGVDDVHDLSGGIRNAPNQSIRRVLVRREGEGASSVLVCSRTSAMAVWVHMLPVASGRVSFSR